MEERDIVRRLTPTECERLQGFPDEWTLIGEPEIKKVRDSVTEYSLVDGEIVAKTTKLDTFHDEVVFMFTDSTGKRVKVLDSARYKALGNSIALPQWWWLMCRMAKYLPEKPTLGSLFDGIGGFPLVFEERFGKGSARWASEIEEFPIAVTKARFGEG